MTRLARSTVAIVGWAWALGAQGCGGGSGGDGGSGDAMQGDSDGPCGAAVCLQPRSDDANAPRLTAVTVADGSSPFDPWTLILDTEFTDANGDLDPGSAEVTIGAGVTSFELGELFRQRGLAAGVTAGRVAVSVRFTENLADDSTFDVGVQLVDGAGLRSNCYALRLHVGVGPP